MHVIYLIKQSQVSLQALEYIYSIYKCLKLSCLFTKEDSELELKLMKMQQKLLNKDFSIYCEKTNLKNSKELLDYTENKDSVLLVESENIEDFCKRYSDLLKQEQLNLWVFSTFENLLWKYNFQEKSWISHKTNNQESYINKLGYALRQSHKEQTVERFDHTIRVVLAAQEIINSLNLDKTTQEKIMLACAYHDFSKNWNKEKLIMDFQKTNPKDKDKPIWALHGPVASNYLLDNKLITDQSILKAIEKHTEPSEELDIVGKILVLADKMEPFKKNNFPPGEFEDLWEKLRKGNYEEVFTTVLKYPTKKVKN